MKVCFLTTVLFVLAVSIGLPADVWAVTVELEATDDNYFQTRLDVLADNNMGAYSQLRVGGDNVDDYNLAIIRFDLVGNPAPSGDGTLSLFIIDPRDYGIGGRTVEVFKIKPTNAGWIEGRGPDGGKDALPGEPCWLYKEFDTVEWDGGGGMGAHSDGSGVALATDGFEGATPGDLTPLSAVTTSSALVSGDSLILTIPQSVIQGWIDNPDDNAGLLVRDSNATSLVTSRDQLVIASSESDAGPILAYVTGAVQMPGDANLDGMVTDADAAILASHWQQTGVGWSQGDFNGDTNVTDSDAAILASHWQEGVPGEAAAVPEPSTLALLSIAVAFGLVALCRRRI